MHDDLLTSSREMHESSCLVQSDVVNQLGGVEQAQTSATAVSRLSCLDRGDLRPSKLLLLRNSINFQSVCTRVPSTRQRCSKCSCTFTLGNAQKFCTVCGTPNGNQEVVQDGTISKIPTPRNKLNGKRSLQDKQFDKVTNAAHAEMAREKVRSHLLIEKHQATVLIPAPQHSLVSDSKIPTRSHRSENVSLGVEIDRMFASKIPNGPGTLANPRRMDDRSTRAFNNKVHKRFQHRETSVTSDAMMAISDNASKVFSRFGL